MAYWRSDQAGIDTLVFADDDYSAHCGSKELTIPVPPLIQPADMGAVGALVHPFAGHC